MVALPGLETYSPDDLQKVRALSPAFARYDNLLSDSLHGERHRAWMMCVLATHLGRASAADICAFWSATADRLVARAWQECGLAQTESVLFALGKQGASELNLSSDIDVMVVAEGRDLASVEKGLRKFQKMLSHNGPEGFCFRLDFDLRPGGKMGPLITTTSQFQDYYWSQGETWERLALVRLRALTGSRRLAESIQDLARRFSFRKFLDFTLLEDLKALRSQVHQKGFDRREGETHLKLEVGGIRDIELFVHSLLVMNGGKLPVLQTQSTSEALRLLAEKNLLPESEARFLHETYWLYRHHENLVQSLEDRQTHSLIGPVPEIRAKMEAVDKIVSSLLGRVDLESVRLPPDENAQKAWLLELGFSEAAINSTWNQLVNATALSYKNDRDERARKEFLYSFVTELAVQKGLDRDLGLSILVDFVKATRAKATFFSMLLRTPGLIHDLARLFCLSPYVGAIIASRPELLDHFILRVDEDWSSDLETALGQMGERKLLTEVWAANQFLSDRDLPAMSARITETADSICRQLLLQLRHEFPASQMDIIALGKWAGAELGLRSDLDFIFVTPGAPSESDFKVARRFISRLTDPSRGGSLYDVDLRLRPSGQSGTLLVAIDKLHAYWRDFAKPWERQAYLRARPLRESLALDKSLLIEKGLSAEDLSELMDIRGKLLRKPGADSIDIKYAPGGLVDIELETQTAILAKRLVCTETSTAGMLALLGEMKLTKIYYQLREFEQILQLSSSRKTGEAQLNSPIFMKAANLMGLSSEDAWESLIDLLHQAQNLVSRMARSST